LRRRAEFAASVRSLLTAVLSVGMTCMFFLQQVHDRDKLRAIVLEMATDPTS